MSFRKRNEKEHKRWKDRYICSHSKTVATPKEFGMSEEKFQKVGTLKPSLRNLNLIVKVVNIGEPRQVYSKKTQSEHKIAEALVGDETGAILLSLWDDQIGNLNPNEVIQMKNCYTSLFRGSLRLNIGRYGTTEKMEQEIEKVNTENNLSEKRYQMPTWRTPSKQPYRRRRRRY
jgi:replication factor A1